MSTQLQCYSCRYMCYSWICSQLQYCTLGTLMYYHESTCDFMSAGLCPHVLSRKLACTVNSSVHSCRLSCTNILACALTVRSHVGNNGFSFVLSCDITLNHDLRYVCTVWRLTPESASEFSCGGTAQSYLWNSIVFDGVYLSLLGQWARRCRR